MQLVLFLMLCLHTSSFRCRQQTARVQFLQLEGVVGGEFEPLRPGKELYDGVRNTAAVLSVVAAAMQVPRLVFAAESASSDSEALSVIADAGVEKVGEETMPTRGFQTKSGLKMFDLREGTIGPSPRYGQLVTFHYTSYYKASPESPLDVIDSSYLTPGRQPFLHKHGNGRVVRGVDEALHTMKVGGKRRAIIPSSIGYTELGLGPLPIDGKRRRKLGDLIDLLIKDQGELYFDLELLLVADDENDQGYYDDQPVTQEEVRQLVLKSLGADKKMVDEMEISTPKGLFKR